MTCITDHIYSNMIVRFEVPDQTHRRPEQIYVMGLQESPKTTKIDYDSFSGFFNWTMTYRLDSDIPHPYGRTLPKSSEFSYSSSMPHWEHVFTLAEFAKSLGQRSREFRALAHRPKAVAWIVSHCDTESDREMYVEELQKHIQVRYHNFSQLLNPFQLLNYLSTSQPFSSEKSLIYREDCWVDLDFGCSSHPDEQLIATVTAHQPGELPKSNQPNPVANLMSLPVACS